MLKKIYRLNWDSGILNKIINWLRKREVSQEFIYSWEWASNYLNYVSDSFLRWWTVDSKKIDINPWKNILWKYSNRNKHKRDVYIWVACWDSTRDIEFIKSLWKKNILYIGVDLSSEMIEKSEKNLNKESFDYILIQSDIFNPDLISQIDLIIDKSDIKSFLFLWWTFWNFRTTSITDLLGSYLKKWEKLYIDIFTKSKYIEDEFKLHEYYINKCNDSKIFLNFIFSSFFYIDFPIEKWEIVVNTSKDNQIWLFWIHFNLRLKENIEFLLNNQVAIFSKWEEITFLSAIYYEPNKLIDFMKIHHFKTLDKDLNNWVLWQFLFEKE